MNAWLDDCSCSICVAGRAKKLLPKPPEPPPAEVSERHVLNSIMRLNLGRGIRGHGDNAICQSCGAHSVLKTLPYGVGLVVEREPRSGADETIADAPRYVVKKETFDLGGGFHANMRFCCVVDSDQPIIFYEHDGITFANPVIAEEWASKEVLYHSYVGTLAANGVYNALGQKSSKEKVWEKIKAALPGQFVFFMTYFIYKLEVEQALLGFGDIVHTTTTFNNRVHEQKQDYLLGWIVRVHGEKKQ